MHSNEVLHPTSKNILISGYNLNAGGGRLLLESILLESPGCMQITLFADCRLRNTGIDKLSKNLKIYYVRNNMFSRMIAEIKMWAHSSKFHLHLCLGNLPPLFGSKSSVHVLVHSRYLVDKSLDRFLPYRKLLITLIERFWFRVCISDDHKVIVQTPSMKELLLAKFGSSLKVRVQPFTKLETKTTTARQTNSFLYVASVDPHKNHKNLLNAWKILKDEGILPKLILVIPQNNNDLANFVSRFEIDVEFIINPNREELLNIYKNSKCLIHPSYFESLGLVLIEANYFGLDIIAPESDYVRDIVSPLQSFDPYSPKSIARAIRRYLGFNEPLLKIETPSDFWNNL